jgi:hypothetical protein
MRKNIILGLICACAMVGCVRENRMETYRAEKHIKDSTALVSQQQSLAFYQAQLDSLVPKADSLIPLFKYEKDEKYQDHGFYVTTAKNGMRVEVRDDGETIVCYRNGKRLETAEGEAVEKGQALQIVMHDINELEKRIHKTNLEIEKYQRRLNANPSTNETEKE